MGACGLTQGTVQWRALVTTVR